MLIQSIVLLSILSGAPQQGAPVPADAHAAIAAANAAWVPALKKGDAAAVAAPYADDALFVTAQGFVVKGRDGVGQLMRSRFTQMGAVISGSIVQDGLTVQGDLVYEWGHASLESTKDGARQHSGGRYLTVWQKTAAGKWQIIRNLSLPE
jgi:uncharacterized protein (TIGR02246 family)